MSCKSRTIGYWVPNVIIEKLIQSVTVAFGPQEAQGTETQECGYYQLDIT
jgi:hypothetical protein